MDQTRNRRDNERETGQRWRGTANAPPQTNPEAFATNFRTLTPALYDFLNRLSGRDETAAALMRQVASQAAMSAASADQWPSARAWLFARAYTALPTEPSAAAADPTPYIEPDLSMLPPVGPDDGLDDMTRAVWRAISALPVEQHALLHLHTREAMVVGEAASVLGITEREAADRLQRLTPAVEAASRALFLIRYGRPRDPELDALLARLNITRLTPEARASIEEYADRSPTAKRMLAAVPPPLTVYAALLPLAPPAGIAEEAIAGAIPWLPLVEEATTAIDLPTTALPEEPAYVYGADSTTGVTPTADPWEYGQQQPDEEHFGTRALDIPVRQRVVQEESAVYVPPRRTNRAMGPLALLGLLGGVLVVVVGALVLFLARGDSGTPVSVTATVGGTPTQTSVSTALSPALATSTALAALLSTSTPFPTATTAPLPPSTASSASIAAPTTVPTLFVTPTPLGTEAAGSPSAPIDTPVAKVTLAPVSTLAPISTPANTLPPIITPAPRVTPIPTDTAAPTKPPATTPTHTPAPTAKPATATPTEAASGPTATGGAGGAITLDKTSITLGAGGTSGSVRLANAGPSAVPFTARSNIPALTVAPASGTVPASGSVPATIVINRAGLTPGTYSGTVTFTTSSGSFSAVTVTFTV